MATAKKKKRGPNKAVRVRRLLQKCHEAWSLAIRLRDGKCMRCGATENLAAHHWIVSRARSRRYRFDVQNGISLCYGCHVHGVHVEASMAAVYGIFKAQSFISWDKVVEMMDTAARDTKENDQPFTEEGLATTLNDLERLIGETETRNHMEAL